MSQPVLIQLEALVPDELETISGEFIDCSGYYRLSLALKGSPGDSVVIMGTTTDIDTYEDLNKAFHLGTLDIGNVLTLDVNRSTGDRIFALRRAGRGVGTKLVSCGPSLVSDDIRVPAIRKSLGSIDVPNDVFSASDWYETDWDAPGNIVAFSTRRMLKGDLAAIQVSLSGDGSFETPYTPDAIIGVVGIDSILNVPRNFRAWRIIRKAGTRNINLSAPQVNAFSLPFGPLLATHPPSGVRLIASGILNGAAGTWTSDVGTLTKVGVGVYDLDLPSGGYSGINTSGGPVFMFGNQSSPGATVADTAFLSMGDFHASLTVRFSIHVNGVLTDIGNWSVALAQLGEPA